MKTKGSVVPLRMTLAMCIRKTNRREVSLKTQIGRVRLDNIASGRHPPTSREMGLICEVLLLPVGFFYEPNIDIKSTPNGYIIYIQKEIITC